ncbi:LLM class flavin-dependent oxidoreductase, partial [Bacillus sp. S34]|nr:LLM class flavin-dependent oxidoreductase [Bacillus sp. S34]
MLRQGIETLSLRIERHVSNAQEIAEWLDRHPGGLLDPVPILAALASVTTRIGLVGTASTTYNDPVDLAERGVVGEEHHVEQPPFRDPAEVVVTTGGPAGANT